MNAEEELDSQDVRTEETEMMSAAHAQISFLLLVADRAVAILKKPPAQRVSKIANESLESL